MTPFGVCVVGSFMKDLVVRVPRLPRRGETLHGTEFAEFLGGKGVNQAVAASRSGARTGDGRPTRRGRVRTGVPRPARGRRHRRWPGDGGRRQRHRASDCRWSSRTAPTRSSSCRGPMPP
ncbi:PfkB family carbohydrate kinase [Fodinicola feengrottensis]|uniref:PfkB family carbohydrate kinase n=1 Tax=Fodinicola feengrottensis TaxID=435914 RepID=UPI0013D6B2DD|nr:PfkB family carbohydrate kinase [Fodinicola feengrottensis]